MNPDYDKILDDYRAAKAIYDAAERDYAVACAGLRNAERARREGWDKLVRAAEQVPNSAKKQLAEEQYGPAPS